MNLLLVCFAKVNFKIKHFLKKDSSLKYKFYHNID